MPERPRWEERERRWGKSFVLSHPFKDQGEGGDFFEKMGEGGCRKVQQLPKISNDSMPCAFRGKKDAFQYFPLWFLFSNTKEN